MTTNESKNPMNTLFVGIDVGSDKNMVHMKNFNNEKLEHFEFINDKIGIEILKDRTLDVLKKHTELKYIDFVLESTSVYAVHTATFLSTEPNLLKFNPSVYCINPKVSANFRLSYINRNKNDNIDADILAEIARIGFLKNTKPWRGTQYLALQRLTRHRRHLANMIVREKNYILSNVFLKFSGLITAGVADSPFSDLYGTTSLSILEEFLSCEEIIDTSIEDLVAFLNDKGKNRFLNPTETAKKLKQAASNSYRLDKVNLEPINLAISSSINIIRTYQAEISSVNKGIENTVKGINDAAYNILLSIPGIGPTIAAGILAEIGSIDNFKNDSALAKFAGLTWTEHQSSNFKQEETSLTKTGSSYLRYYLVEAADKIRKYDPIYSNYYQKKKDESKTHKEARARVLTARKLVKLIYALLSSNQLYKH